MVRFQEEDYDSDEDDVSLPQAKNTSPIMPDVYEATGEADTYINIYSNSGKISTHNKKAKQTYNERNQAGKVFVKVFILKSASNLNDNLNCSKELEHYAS